MYVLTYVDEIVNQNYKVGQEFKLKDILIHNTLFEMYPQLREYKVKVEDMNSNNKKIMVN